MSSAATPTASRFLIPSTLRLLGLVIPLGLALASRPLAAACFCTVTAAASPPTWNFSATSSGACEHYTAVLVRRDGLDTGFRACEWATSCSLSEPRSSACLRTGTHTVSLSCACGKNATDPSGNPFCDDDTGTDETTFDVNTTPTVSVSVSGPEVNGDAVISAPYTFPNTDRTKDRDLSYFVDGDFHFGSSDEALAGTWTFTEPTDCWRQGTHDVKIVATACHEGDPLFNAEAHTPLIVDHKPQVTLEVGAQQPDGDYEAIVSYSYPQTKLSRERGLQLKAYPSGAIIGEWSPFEREGVWKPEVACGEGKDRLLIAKAFACGDTEALDAAVIPACPKPPRPDSCGDPGERCENCLHPAGGGLGSVGVGGDGPALAGGGVGFGPRARLSYLAGGAGNLGNPGQAAWNAVLGRNWSHDYAERIVPDPSVSGRVWLITRAATFRRFTDANGDGLYEAAWPEDEYRTLSRVGGGWELRDLEGTVESFDNAGLWLRTEDRNGNAKVGSYSGGRLVSVAMPDGRSETFGYDGAGKLASITEVGVGGAAQRTWSYGWAGDDLVSIARPDGTELRFVYGDPGNPGSMTRAVLVGADDGDSGTPRPERVEGAWEYDFEGNVLRAWRGAEDFASGVDRYELAYDNPFEPTETTVTIHRSPTEQETVVYTLSRTAQWVGGKPRVTSISGGCPSCGLGPNAQLFYDDAANPLLPTRTLDGRGNETLLTYDSHGRLIEKVEAAGTAVSRSTSWRYDDPAFPGLPTRIEVPSTAGGAALRTTLLDYDAGGNLTSRKVQGVEAGSFFDLETVTTFNTAGQPLTIDPPGHGTDDTTSFTYDPARGDLLPATRTEPLAGTTVFGYDAFNRRTEVSDPNGLITATTYDALNRVRSVIQEGERPSDNLVTTHTYNTFGDLVRTTLPRGNVIEYGYDATGRLVSVERKPDAVTPGERTVYTLDGLGNRVREELQRWSGGGWETRSFTDFVYTSRCQVGKVVHADGTATEYAYDCGGNLEKVWDENHPRLGGGGGGEGGGDDCDRPLCEPPPGDPSEPTTVYTYDALDRLTSVSQPWTGAGGGSAVTTYGYDVQNHLVAVTDAEGNTTTYTYSDRDLMTRQVSLVSGTTSYTHDAHGELVAETDGRGITVNRTLDALDRLTFVDSPDPALDTTFTYDDPAVPFSKGRLTAISRSGSMVAYAYDRFGRMVQDGELTYGYDANGNRATIGYPGNVVARYGHDFADREASLEVQVGAGAPQPIVAGAAYEPSGPLASLTLGNGLVETRTFTPRYLPGQIDVPERLKQTYTTDAVGNIRTTERAVRADTFLATYAYQEPQYFLTEGHGPWGNLVWSYDRIGNRLSETPPAREDEDAPPFDVFRYSYEPNPTGGNTPKLSRIEPAPGGEPGSFLTYGFDAAGDQTQVTTVGAECSGRTSFFDYSAERRLALLHTSDGTGTTELTYDGRGFLARSRLTFAESSDFIETDPVYSSAGVLMARRYHQEQTPPGGDGDGSPVIEPVTQHTTSLFYFAGRPVAQLRRHEVGAGDDELLYLTTDHLGVPLLATDKAGDAVWAGGLDPFGTPFVFSAPKPPGDDTPPPPPPGGETPRACEPEAPAGLASLESLGLFLRFPGQWDDPSFYSHGLHRGLYYNVNRYFEAGTARYMTPDPLVLPDPIDFDDSYFNLYEYSAQNPIQGVDPLGLLTLPPDTTERCRRRWERKILPRLQSPSRDCKDYFCRELNTDLEALLSGPFPLIVLRQGLGGSFGCSSDDIANDPTTITVGRRSLCGSTSDALHVVLHELGHYADCWNNGNRFPFGDERDGCGAEVACFGFSIGENCKRLGYPTR